MFQNLKDKNYSIHPIEQKNCLRSIPLNKFSLVYVCLIATETSGVVTQKVRFYILLIIYIKIRKILKLISLKKIDWG